VEIQNDVVGKSSCEGKVWARDSKGMMESKQIIEATPWEVPWRRQGSTDRGGGTGTEEETYDDRRLSDCSHNPQIRGEGVVKQPRTTSIAKHTMDD